MSNKFASDKGIVDTALALCPFCGNSPGTSVIHTEDYYAYVVCRSCGANGPAIAVFECEGSSRDKAIAAWNSRNQICTTSQ